MRKGGDGRGVAGGGCGDGGEEGGGVGEAAEHPEFCLREGEEVSEGVEKKLVVVLDSLGAPPSCYVFSECFPWLYRPPCDRCAPLLFDRTRPHFVPLLGLGHLKHGEGCQTYQHLNYTPTVCLLTPQLQLLTS